MSRKNKSFKAFIYQNPTATVHEAWDAEWANQQWCYTSRKHEEQQTHIDALEAKVDALEAELEDTITECLGAKSNEDILRKKVEELEGALWEIADGKHSDNNLTAMHFARLKLSEVS